MAGAGARAALQPGTADELFAEVERLVERQQTTVVELLRRFTRLGLLATQLQERPNRPSSSGRAGRSASSCSCEAHIPNGER